MALGSLSLLFDGWILYYTWSTNRFTSGSGPNNAVLFHRGYLHNGSVRSQSQFNSSDQATVRNDLIIPLRKSITETFFLRISPVCRYYHADYPKDEELDYSNACFVRDHGVWQTRSLKQLAQSHKTTKRVYRSNLSCKHTEKTAKCTLGIFCW